MPISMWYTAWIVPSHIGVVLQQYINGITTVKNSISYTYAQRHIRMKKAVLSSDIFLHVWHHMICYMTISYRTNSAASGVHSLRHPCAPSYSGSPWEMWLWLRMSKYKNHLRVNIFSNQVNITLELMPEDLVGGKSILVQVIDWCSQTTSHYQNQCDEDLWRHMASPGNKNLTEAPHHNHVTKRDYETSIEFKGKILLDKIWRKVYFDILGYIQTFMMVQYAV